MHSDGSLDAAKTLLDLVTLEIKGGIEVCNDALLLSGATLTLRSKFSSVEWLWHEVQLLHKRLLRRRGQLLLQELLRWRRERLLLMREMRRRRERLLCGRLWCHERRLRRRERRLRRCRRLLLLRGRLRRHEMRR